MRIILLILESGVPQGSTVESSLFFLYVFLPLIYSKKDCKENLMPLITLTQLCVCVSAYVHVCVFV